jgi:hypothetical protein
MTINEQHATTGRPARPVVRVSDPDTVIGVAVPWTIAGSDQPIHGMFGLSYSNYLVCPRSVMQSMPVDWQRAFVALWQQLQQAAADLEWPLAYQVKAGHEACFSDLTDEQMAELGVKLTPEVPAAEFDEMTDEQWDAWHDQRKWHWDGQEWDGDDTIHIPGPDPIPYYNRGRARVPLRPVRSAVVGQVDVEWGIWSSRDGGGRGGVYTGEALTRDTVVIASVLQHRDNVAQAAAGSVLARVAPARRYILIDDDGYRHVTGWRWPSSWKPAAEDDQLADRYLCDRDKHPE